MGRALLLKDVIGWDDNDDYDERRIAHGHPLDALPALGDMSCKYHHVDGPECDTVQCKSQIELFS